MARCPKCGRKFRSDDQVTRHLSQPFSLCVRVERSVSSNLVRLGLGLQPASQPVSRLGDQLQEWEPHEDAQDYGMVPNDILEPNDHSPCLNRSELPPRPPDPQPPDPSYVREEFTGAAKIWGMGSTFMDKFDADVHATTREANAFYPFASHEDWELACFLLSSGLSMSRIDQFLSLGLVCTALRCLDHTFIFSTTDKAASNLIPDCNRPQRTCRAAASRSKVAGKALEVHASNTAPPHPLLSRPCRMPAVTV